MDYELPGSPDDVAGLLKRHGPRIDRAVRELRRRKPRTASNYFLAIALDHEGGDGRRRVRIGAFPRGYASKVPGMNLLAPKVTEAAPEGMLHLVILSNHWQNHMLVPLRPTTR